MGGCVQHCVVTILTDNTGVLCPAGIYGFRDSEHGAAGIAEVENGREGASRHDNSVALTRGQSGSGGRVEARRSFGNTTTGPSYTNSSLLGSARQVRVYESSLADVSATCSDARMRGQYGPTYRDIRVIVRNGLVHHARATSDVAKWRCTCGLTWYPLEVCCLPPYAATACSSRQRRYEFQPAIDAVK